MRFEREMTAMEWQREVFSVAKEHGWWDDPTPKEASGSADIIAARLCLIHSEVSEALEALRDGKVYHYDADGKPEGMETELADVVIRVLDLAQALDMNIGVAMERKNAFNRRRPHRHGGKAL